MSSSSLVSSSSGDCVSTESSAPSTAFELYADGSSTLLLNGVPTLRLDTLGTTYTRVADAASHVRSANARQFCALAVSANVPQLAQIAAFRNLHTEPVCLVQRLLSLQQTADVFTVTSPLVFTRWAHPAQSLDSVSLGDDGIVTVDSLDGLARLRLFPDRTRFEVIFPGRIADEDPGAPRAALAQAALPVAPASKSPTPTTSGVRYTWVTQEYTLARFPPRWSPAVELALAGLGAEGLVPGSDAFAASVLGANTHPAAASADECDASPVPDTFATSTDVVMALPPCVENAFAGGSLTVPLRAPGELLGGPGLVVRDEVVSQLSARAWVRDANVLSLRAIGPGDEVIGTMSGVSQTALILEDDGAVVHEVSWIGAAVPKDAFCPRFGDVAEMAFVPEAVPPRMDAVLAGMKGVLRRRQARPAPSTAGVSDVRMAVCGKPRHSAAVIEERVVPDVVTLTAYEDGRGRGVFSDRTLVEVDGNGDRVTLILPSGERVYERVAAPLSAPEHVELVAHFRAWAVMSPAEQAAVAEQAAQDEARRAQLSGRLFATRAMAARLSIKLPSTVDRLASGASASNADLIARIDALLE